MNLNFLMLNASLLTIFAELDEKTKAMLKVIEEDADSFAQRAEMYYKKRPELISMVEDFYRAHRSLAERYDQVKSDSATRLLTPWASPLSLSKHRLGKLMGSTEKSYDSYSDTYDHEESGESDREESGESEVDDPDQEEETQFDEKMEEEEVSSGVCNEELLKLKEAIEELKEENKIQKEQLLEKDEEKREAIRQLSLALDVLKEENTELRKKIVKDSPKKENPFEFNKLKCVFWGRRLFSESPKSQAGVTAL